MVVVGRWPNIVGTAASVVDRAFAAAIQAHGRRESQEADAMPHAARLAALEEIRVAYEGDALVIVVSAGVVSIVQE